MSEPNPKQRYGDLKVPIGLVPPVALVHAGAAMRNGAEKYGPYNFRDAPVECMTYVHAALRHLLAYLDGEQVSADAGVHHLGHVIACCAILLDGEALDTLIDNRPAKGAVSRILAEYERPAAPAAPHEPADKPAHRTNGAEPAPTPQGQAPLVYSATYHGCEHQARLNANGEWLARARVFGVDRWGPWVVDSRGRTKAEEHAREELRRIGDPVGDALDPEDFGGSDYP